MEAAICFGQNRSLQANERTKAYPIGKLSFTIQSSWNYQKQINQEFEILKIQSETLQIVLTARRNNFVIYILFETKSHIFTGFAFFSVQQVAGKLFAK